MPEVNHRTECVKARRSPHAPGRMTAVIRPLQAATGPKVLRVALVVGGRLLEERIFKRRIGVTVGPSEKATFVVEANVPPRFKLFDRIGDDYYLNILDGMTGRLALPTGVADLVTLGGEARGGGPVRAIRLTEEVRGKVVIGNATLLFQFVTALPIQPRPRLPLSVKDGGASRIDWKLAFIAAMSFLVHFGLVGAMYSDWMDTVVDDDLAVALVHDFEPTPLLPVETTAVAGGEGELVTAATAAAAARPTSTSNRTRPGAVSRPEAIADGLLGTLNRVNFAVIGSLNGGPNLDRAMTATDNGPPVDLDALAREALIGNATGGGLDLPMGMGGPIQPSGSGLDLPTRETGETPTSAGRAARVAVAVDVHEESPLLSAPLANAEAVIRKQIHPGARRCYQKGLDSDPSQSGKLVVTIRVAPSGEVDSATVSNHPGLSAGVADCIATVARRAKFDPTGPGGATVVVPFGFFRQGG
jgi:hypothetical protein